jgi:hypothetical protein
VHYRRAVVARPILRCVRVVPLTSALQQVVANYTSGCVRIVVGFLATSMSIALALAAGKKLPKKTAAPS